MHVKRLAFCKEDINDYNLVRYKINKIPIKNKITILLYQD